MPEREPEHFQTTKTSRAWWVLVGGLLVLLKRDPAGATVPGPKAPAPPPEPVPPDPPPQHPASDDDWVPPPHAVPFGPFLALAALEQLLVGALLQEAYFSLLARLWR